MPDGGMAEDFLHIAGLLQVLNGNGTMKPFVLIGIENTERRRDMTGPTTNPGGSQDCAARRWLGGLSHVHPDGTDAAGEIALPHHG